MSEHSLVQAIVLEPKAKRLPAELAVKAAALASLGAYEFRPKFADDALTGDIAQRWNTWEAGRFTKSVRVAKSRSDFEALQRISDHVAVSSSDRYALHGNPTASACAFSPLPYESMDPRILRARVEGLRCAVALPIEHYDNAEWQFDIVADMSDGKTAAQLAHAMVALRMQSGRRIESSSVARVTEPRTYPPELTITDAGLTEFGGRPTETVRVYRRR